MQADMTTCGYCRKRKGKRTCPTLGWICPSCCGEHRGREISCPPDCAHVRRVDDSLQRSFQNVYARLVAFVMNEQADWCAPAVEAFLDESRTLNDWEQDAFQTYLALGYRGIDGERGIDLFCRAQVHALSKIDVEVLGYMKDARPSLFSIEEVHRDVGLQLHDMLEDRSLFVRERLATHTVESGSLVLAWVTRVRDHHELVAGFTLVPPAHAELVIDAIETECGKDMTEPSGIPEGAVFSAILPAVHRVLRKAVEEYAAPQLLTDAGEELIQCRAVYEILDPEVVRQRLATHRDVKQIARDEFQWMGTRRAAPLDHQAEISIRTVRLELLTMTRPDLAAGKRFLNSVLGNRVQHRTDSVKDFPTLDIYGPRDAATRREPATGRSLMRDPRPGTANPFRLRRARRTDRAGSGHPSVPCVRCAGGPVAIPADP